MSENSWHHGNISRNHAEHLLSDSLDGTFLVRESTTFPGEDVLSVSYGGQVIHYRLMLTKDPYTQHQVFTIDDEVLFDTITDLIYHYLLFADGLCTRLVRWLPKPSLTGPDDFQTRFFRPLQVEAIKKLKWRKQRFERNKILPAMPQKLLDLDTSDSFSQIYIRKNCQFKDRNYLQYY